MPDDRFLHPRLRISAKVSALSDLEFRVWVDYVLSSDNFGVMPDSAAMLRGGNVALAARPETEIRCALDRIVRTGLLLRFQHQGQHYLCDPVWQDFQKIRYPKATYYPTPPQELFGKLSAKTRGLFREHHEAFRGNRARSARVDQRLTANGLRPTRNGIGASSGSGTPPPTDTFEAFWGLYPRKVAKAAAEGAWTKAMQYTAAADILVGLRRQIPELTTRESKYVPHPATWLNQSRWKDEPTATTRIARSARGNPQEVAAQIRAQENPA
jgi:hypothetical protein